MADGGKKADIVVKDLEDLIGNLSELIEQFDGALDFQNDEKGHWGQHNANSSMGDFADNWTVHRDKMVKAMKKFRKSVETADTKWTDADRLAAGTLKGRK